MCHCRAKSDIQQVRYELYNFDFWQLFCCYYLANVVKVAHRGMNHRPKKKKRYLDIYHIYCVQEIPPL